VAVCILLNLPTRLNAKIPVIPHTANGVKI
jgi:hypothetical protein